MKPLGKHVVLDIKIKNETSLIIPNSEKQIRKDYTGVVDSVGNEVTLVKKDDEVAFRQNSVVWANADGMLAVLEESIVAIL